MSGNQRKHIRTKLRADVKIFHPELGDLTLQTGDISNDGAYILAQGNSMPEIGESLKVQMQGISGGNAPVMEMKIVRVDKLGIGLQFIVDE
ncbi:MAG: hypothetical protein ACJAYG_001774 [Oceanicoccus sp.]